MTKKIEESITECGNEEEDCKQCKQKNNVVSHRTAFM